jgi:uncharacterized protein YndB with AHSA1/START domain
MTEKKTVRGTHRFKAPAERVFDAWLNPDLARQFLFATDTGTMVRADIDPRVGGEFTFVDRRDGEDIHHAGTYLEIDRPDRLKFKFGVPKYSAEFVEVTIDIVRVGDGCELTLSQTGTLPEYEEKTIHGWTTILENADRILK